MRQGPSSTRTVCRLLVLSVIGLFPLTTAQPAGADDDVHHRLQSVVEQTASKHLVPGAHLYVEGPRVGAPFNGAAGRTALFGGEELHPEDPGRLASTTKTFTAVAILRLHEDGRMGLDDPITRWLERDITRLIPHSDRITIRMLLNHTSGMSAHDEDPAYIAQVATMPRRRWTAREQIEIASHTPPHFEPGEGQRYSDTGYVVLGQIIERVTGQNLGAAVRELAGLDRLGLRSTWWELFEPAPPGARPRAHDYQYVYDVHGHDPSFDSYGGGGLVSTPADAARFMRALFDGRVFRHRRTLGTMLGGEVPTEPLLGVPQVGYAYGLARMELDGISCWAHPGHWGSFMAYCPELDTVLAGMTHQNRDEHDRRTDVPLWRDALAVVREASKGAGLELAARPRRVRAGRRSTVTFRATSSGAPVPGVVVRFARRGLETDARGVARTRIRPRGPRILRARACKPGVGCATAVVRVVAGTRGR